jgi:hypothetical protein
MEIFNYLLLGLGWLMVLLILYVILFKVYYATEGDRPWWLYPLALVFVILDFLINTTLMWILMLDPPREWLVTARMQRYKASPANRRKGLHLYRWHVAENLCLILNLFDKGHC